MNKLLNLSQKERHEIEGIFHQLKPVCDQVALKPSIKNAKELKSVLESLNPEMIELFDQYIFVPILMHLSNRTKHKSDTICVLLECLHTVLLRTTITDLNLFLRVFILVFSQVLDEKKPGKLSSSSEELKLNIVQCATTLIKRSPKEVLKAFYKKHHYGKLSMGVYACTRITLNEKSIQLRKETLKALIYLVQIHEDSHSCYEFRQQVADVVMLMLPGIVSNSLNIATATDIQNHKIVVLAIRLWSRTVGLVMEDNLIDNENPNTKVFSLIKTPAYTSPETTIDWSSNQANTKEKIQQMTRSRHWIENSNQHLMAVTKAFSDLHCHQHWKVRLELVQAANHILSKASKNMTLSVPYLIELLIILSQDEQLEVRSASIASIKLFAETCKLSKGVKSLIEIVEESMYELVTKLPRILHGIDLTLKEKQLSLVSGYLDILGDTHVPGLLRSVQHLHRLLNCIFIACTLDSTSITLLEEISLRRLDDECNSSVCEWHKFKYCNTQKSQYMVEQICSKLIKYSNLSLFLHFLLDNFNSEVTYRKEITLIFCYIFSSGRSNVESDIESSLNVFKSLMDKNLWGLPISTVNVEGITKEEAQSNVVQVCLLTEAVSSFASFIGQELFAPLLLNCLYPLLECAGSSLYIISIAGLRSVNKIAELYGGDVSNLVSNNVDYLSHHVTLNLRHAHRNPRVLAVLSVIMKHSSFNVLPSLHEIVFDVLVQSCDTFQEVNASAFLQVFHTFISSLKAWCADECIFPEEKIKCKKSIVEELLDYQRTKLEANQLDDDNDGVSPTGIPEEEISSYLMESNKTEIPNHINLTIQILQRSLHFLPSKIQSRQIIVLEILDNGVMLLRKWTDELLPLVHKIWSPLVQRFHNCDNYLLLQRAFSLLKTLGKVSKDFIRNRTIKELLPILCDTLKRTSKDSLKCEKVSYKMSQKYKLQLSLLKGISELSLDMEFPEKEIDNVLESITPYLSNLQPQTLQEACVDSFKLIAKEFPDLIWIHLMTICPKQLNFKPPNELFPTYQFQDKSKEMKEYKKNVHLLFDLI